MEHKDVNLEENLFNVRQAKKGRNRVMPHKRCGVERLTRYAAARGDQMVGPKWPRFFIREDRMPVSDCWTRYNFALVAKRPVLRKRRCYCGRGVGVRIHGRRHTAGVHRIINWFRLGCDIDREVYRLTVQLGYMRPQ